MAKSNFIATCEEQGYGIRKLLMVEIHCVCTYDITKVINVTTAL